MRIAKRDLKSDACIHEGARSLVYRLDTSAYRKPVVIKLPKYAHPPPRDMARYANEFSMTKDLAVEGVRRALDSVTIDGRPALILEYVEGETFKKTCVEERGTLAQELAVAISITRAVADLHRHNIIHRNISSTNVLVDRAQRAATLIDFGVATKFGWKSSQPEIANGWEGPLHYISPEQTGRMNRSVDYRTDLYSLGVLFYEMLSGRLPFETASAAELIHCHIAKYPDPLCDLDPSIPATVSDIVRKLMAKNAEDRYQTAAGLQADLENCLGRLTAAGAIAPFPLGRDDCAGVLLIPQKLYGRGQELKEMAEAFDRVKEGAGEILLISGAAGVGKSAMVSEFQRCVVDRGGYFIAGRYSEYQRNVPYHAIIQALAELVDLMLTESVQDLSRWKEKIAAAIGGDGAVLVEVIPRLELIIGSQPPSREFGPAEAQLHFHRLFQSLVGAITGNDRLLVFFLDNLQWGDPASFDLLKSLATVMAHGALLFIGAYRDEEVPEAHPLRTTIKAWHRLNAPVRTIHPGNFPQETLNLLVADSLGCEQAHVRPLSDLLHDKSGGNPLIALQLFQSLHQEGFLLFDRSKKQWQWDAGQIEKLEATDDVATLTGRKIAKLPPTSRKILSLAACLGSSFNVADLVAVNEHPLGENLDALMAAMEAGLLLPLDENYQALSVTGAEEMRAECRFEFAHERIRKAFYALLAKKEARACHLAIGRLRLHNTHPSEMEEKVFDIVNHLNEGFQYLREERERVRLAELNLVAGRKAKRTAAYQAAIWYLSMGIGMLPAGKWESHYRLTLDLYLQALEAEVLSDNFERADVLSAELLRHTRDIFTRIKVFELTIMFHAAQKRTAGDLEAVLETAAGGIGTPLERDDVRGHLEKLGQELLLLIREKPASLDTEAIIKASRMLSQEIRLEQLLARLMHIVIENAGAEKGLLIENRGGRLLLQAKGGVDSGKIETMQGAPIESVGEVPLSVVNYVARTETPVVLNDAFHDSSYAADPYISAHRAKSLLCLPIVHQGKLSGLLYLENNLTTHAFTPERLELLKALSSQAAISMENAALYADLERNIRELKEAEETLNDRVRQATLGAEVGAALTTDDTLSSILQSCAESIVTHLDAAFARIWTLNRKENVLELQASAGMYTQLNGPHGRIPVGMYKIGKIALEKSPHLTNSVIGDPRIHDQEWALREGMVSFAGYPLIVEEKVVGVVAMFARKPLNDSVITSLSSIADEVALGIVRKQADEALQLYRDYLEQLVQERTEELARAVEEAHRETERRIAAVEELRHKERLLIQQSRLAAMGEMMGNVAHQWRQPLNILGLIIQEISIYYRQGALNDERMNTLVPKAMKVIAHMSQTINDFSNLLSPDKAKAVFSINDVIERVLSIMHLQAEVNVIAQEECFAEGARNEFSQVIINVLANANDVFRERQVQEPRITIRIRREDSRSVVSIADNGGGIPEEIMGKIFDPYFSTKAPDRGTGIGLFMSKTIIEQSMKGTLSAHNTADGAEFRIEIDASNTP